jgi:hypothetical protein
VSLSGHVVSGGRSGERGANGRHDPVRLICRDLQADWQCQDLGGRLIGGREGFRPGGVPVIGVGSAQVDRRRVVDPCADALFHRCRTVQYGGRT